MHFLFYNFICKKQHCLIYSFASKIMMFQDFNSIALRGYFSMLQQTKCVKMFGRMPPLLTWHIFFTIVNHLSPIVFLCVLKQLWSHCVLNDTLCFVISMSMKLKDSWITNLRLKRFFEPRILTYFKEVSFVIKLLKRVDFCEEKLTQWPSSSPFSLAKLIKSDANLEKKIEEFEKKFEKGKEFFSIHIYGRRLLLRHLCKKKPLHSHPNKKSHGV